MGFYNTIQMFSKENEKKVIVFLLFDRNKEKQAKFTLYSYMRAGGGYSRLLLGILGPYILKD